MVMGYALKYLPQDFYQTYSVGSTQQPGESQIFRFGYLSYDRHNFQSVTGTDMRLVYESSYVRKFQLPLPLTVEYIISITNMLISVLYSFPFLINLMVSRRFQAFTPVLFL